MKKTKTAYTKDQLTKDVHSLSKNFATNVGNLLRAEIPHHSAR